MHPLTSCEDHTGPRKLGTLSKKLHMCEMGTIPSPSVGGHSCSDPAGDILVNSARLIQDLPQYPLHIDAASQPQPVS